MAKKVETCIPENIHRVSLNKEIRKRSVSDECFPFCLKISQNGIQEGETDVPGNIYGVSFIKEIKRRAQATNDFPFVYSSTRKQGLFATESSHFLQ